MLDTAALTVGGLVRFFAHFELERKIPDWGCLGEAGRAQQPQQHSPVQHRVDLGQCFTGDPRGAQQGWHFSVGSCERGLRSTRMGERVQMAAPAMDRGQLCPGTTP